MSGRPQFNIPLFDAVAAQLRATGMTIVSPAELDSPEIREKALASPDGNMAELTAAASNHETWGDVLARDVKLVADGIDGIILLDGWEKSNGARLEAFIGLMAKRQFGRYRGGALVQWPVGLVRDAIMDNMP